MEGMFQCKSVAVPALLSIVITIVEFIDPNYAALVQREFKPLHTTCDLLACLLPVKQDCRKAMMDTSKDTPALTLFSGRPESDSIWLWKTWT